MPTSAEWRIGEFVKVPEWGFGKLRYVQDAEAAVEFFRSSAEEGRFELTLPLVRVERATPPSGIRCFYFSDGWWRAGRLRSVYLEEVALVGTDGAVKMVPIELVYVRCRGSLDDPTDVISAGVLEAPGHAVTRANYVTELLRHRAASRGMTGLVSSRIKLYHHQVEVASRVLGDSVQRYLLADEVGLGKTIEAGIVLRQYLLDHRRGKAVVLAPRLLLRQWRNELTAKFGIDRFGRESVRFAEHGDYGWPSKDVGLVIVDEAHHIASGFSSTDPIRKRAYEDLREVARRTERLLLLSATPLLHNEANFLALLHLIDPTLYPLESLESFTERVRSRRDFAFRFQAFTPEAPDFVIEDHAEAFRDMFPEDEVLRTNLDDLLQAVESGDLSTQEELVREARVHLGETYRLHHRVLRTRRGSPLAREFPVRGRRRPEVITTRWSQDLHLEDWLSNWLDLMSGRTAEGRPDPAVLTALVGLLDRWRAIPQVLETYAHAWLAAGREEASETELSHQERAALAHVEPTEQERGLLSNLVSRLAQDRAKIDWLEEIADGILGQAPRGSVIFCTHRLTASKLADELDRRLSPEQVARYLDDQADLDELETQLDDFASGRAAFLVCDRVGEEGRNLQFASAAVHVDLPWNPNRLEQRIGRLDRHGEGEPVKSFVACTPGDIDESWLRLLVEGYGLFDDSIATLQHVLDGTVGEVVQRLIEFGRTGLEAYAPELRTSLETERREIAQLENLESIEGEGVFGKGLFNGLVAAEQLEGDLQKATEKWLCSTRNSPEGIGVELRIDSERGSVRTYHLGRKSNPQMTSETILEHLGEYTDSARPYTFKRATTADLPHVELLRPGDSLFDAIEDLTEADDLGRTFAFWRRTVWLDEPVVAASVTFRIDADIDGGVELLDEAGGGPDQRGALERIVDGFFGPFALTVWLDRDGNPVTNEDVIDELQKPFRRLVDEPLGSEHIESFEKRFDIDWKLWWDIVVKSARDIVAHESELVQLRERGGERARKAYEYAHRQQELRLMIETEDGHRRRLRRGLQALDRMQEAAVTAISRAVPRPEALGAVLLSEDEPRELFRGSNG